MKRLVILLAIMLTGCSSAAHIGFGVMGRKVTGIPSPRPSAHPPVPHTGRAGRR